MIIILLLVFNGSIIVGRLINLLNEHGIKNKGG